MDGGNALRVAGVTLSEFNPRLPWWGGDLQTIRNYAWSVDHALPSRAARRLMLRLKDGSGDRLVASLHLPEATRARPLVVLIHGLSGSETSCYVILAAAYFLARGYPVLRVNQRGAGPSRRFCREQYHAGRTEDLAGLLDRLDPKLTRHGVLPIGFSLGGNLLLKYLGEVGRNGPVRRAATVSAPLDLAHSCRSLMRWRNYLYHRYILTHLKRNCTGQGAQLSEPRAQGDPRRRVALAARRRLHRPAPRLRRRRGLLRRQLVPALPRRDPRPDPADPCPGRPLRAGRPLSATPVVGRIPPDALAAQERRPPRLPRPRRASGTCARSRPSSSRPEPPAPRQGERPRRRPAIGGRQPVVRQA